MKKNQLYTLIFSAFFIAITGCTKDSNDSTANLKNGLGHGIPTVESQRDPRQIKVVSTDGKALGQAQVLIGDAQNQPFADNFVTTDANGNFMAPVGWTAAATVTISAPGYVRASFLKQVPDAQTFQLHFIEGPRTLELAGTTSGFNVIDKDGIVDFGLVIPGLTKQDLFNFDVGMVISPQMDEISIFGKSIKVPSNITLPEQHESYIFPITLSKEDYRLYFPTTGKKTVFAGRGQFPLKKVVDALRAGTEFYELVNYFKIGGGSLKTIEITGPKNNATLPVDELAFNQKKTFKSPVFDSDQIIMSLALSEYQGSLFPTDIKRVDANQSASMVTAAGGTPLLLAVLKKKTEFQNGPGKDRLSATLVDFADGVQPQLLPLMKDPQIVSITDIKADAVTPLAGMTPVASYAVLSMVTEVATSSNSKTEVLNHVWEVYDPEWSTELQLPAWPNEKPVPGKKRWEISRVGSTTLENGKKLDLGPSMFEHSTHATHVSADF